MHKLLYIVLLIACRQLVEGQIIYTIAGTGIPGYSGDGGPATLAELNGPVGISFDQSSNLIIAEASNHIIRKVDLVGNIFTIAGNGSAGYSGDGAVATAASLNVPVDVCVSDSGDILVAEQNNHVVRKVGNNGIITTYAGTGVLGYSGDGGSCGTATLGTPEAITITKNKNVFIGEWYNNVVRKIDSQAVISTVAGTGALGYAGDGGQASSAEFNRIAGLAVDGQGNLYVSDILNHAVRKIDVSGIITTVAGTGAAGNSGDGGAAVNANLNGPGGLAVDNFGQLYIACIYGHVVRKIDLNGIISTVAGNGNQGYSGDGGLAILAELNNPRGIALDSNGNLYIAEALNNVIRKVTNVVGIKVSGWANRKSILYPNPNNGTFYVETGEDQSLEIEIYNVVGELITRPYDASEKQIKVDGLSSGVYLVKVIINGIPNKLQRIVVTE